MSSSVYLNSINPVEMAKQQFPNGMFSITLNNNFTSYERSAIEYTDIQKENPLDNELIGEILSIDRVQGIEVFKGCQSKVQFPNGSQDFFRVIGLSKKTISEL